MANRIVVGLHSVKECLRVRPQAIKKMWLRPQWQDSNELCALAQLAKKNSIAPLSMSIKQLQQLSHGHQGVAAEVNSQPTVSWPAIYKKERCTLLVLDSIKDPNNLGAILRSAWLLGVEAVLLNKDRSASIKSATVNKVACGAVEHVAVEAVASFASSIKRLKEQGFWAYGLAAEGEQALWQLELPAKLIWFVGAEAKGLRSTSVNLCDQLVNIPQTIKGPSYNASVATALALAESSRQACVAGDLSL